MHTADYIPQSAINITTTLHSAYTTETNKFKPF